MTPEQVVQLLSIPGMIALVFIVVRQQSMLEKSHQAEIDRATKAQELTAELIKQFMALHPPQPPLPPPSPN